MSKSAGSTWEDLKGLDAESDLPPPLLLQENLRYQKLFSDPDLSTNFRNMMDPDPLPYRIQIRISSLDLAMIFIKNCENFPKIFKNKC